MHAPVLSPLDEVLAVASGLHQHHQHELVASTPPRILSSEAVFSSFGDLGISLSGDLHQCQLRIQDIGLSAAIGLLGQDLGSGAGKLLPVAPASWDRTTSSAAAFQAKCNNGGNQVHPLNSWETYVARTPAIDFSALQGCPPSGPAEICFGPGAQLGQVQSSKGPQDAEHVGGDIVNAIILHVASLPSDKQRRFVGRVAALLSPSLLGHHSWHLGKHRRGSALGWD